MPIYEFYCSGCHTVLNFFARTINTSRRPSCPRCGQPELERWVSRFAISKGGAKDRGEQQEGPPDPDAANMERVMEELASEAEGVDEENPRQMARVMRRLYEGSGMPLGERVEEAIRRMEAGESPDQIEEDMGDFWDDGEDSPLSKSQNLHGLVQKLTPPDVDETLYDL